MTNYKGIKYEFDLSIFNGEEFKIKQLPSSLKIEFLRNPLELETEPKSREWLKNCGLLNDEKLYQDYLKNEYFKIVSIVYPYLEKIPFECVVKIWDHGFVAEEIFFERGGFNQVEEFLIKDHPSIPLIGKLIWDIFEEYKNVGHPGNHKRLLIGNEILTRGAVNGSTKGVYHSDLEINEYAKIRIFELAADYAITLGMACSEYYITDEVYDDIELVKLRNHYHWIAVKYGSIQKAIDEIYSILINSFLGFYESYEIVMEKFKHENVQQFLPNFKKIAYGTYSFHLFTNRYKQILESGDN